MSESFKQNLKHTLIALAIFIGLALIYSYPALQGKVLDQHDTVSWKAMSWEAREHYEATGETPLWTNSMFGGMTTYTTYMAGNTQVIYSIQEFFQNLLPSPAYFLFFAMLGFFILLSSLKVNRWVAIIGAVAYAFASYNLQIIAAGHNTKMISLAFMPIAVAGMIALYRGKYISGSLMALAGLAFTIQNGMYQIDYYLLIILFILGIGFLIKAIQSGKLKQFFKATGLMLVCGLLAVSLNLLGVVLTKEYGDLTMRGGQSELTINKSEEDKNKKSGGLDKDYAFSWSQGITETFTLFVPNLYGGGPVYEDGQMVQNAYWGDQPFTAGPFYFGIITMFLMILSLFFIRNKLKWIIFSIGILGIMMSWGRHFLLLNDILFDYLPMYSSFRTPTMAMVIPALCFGLLAFWALSEFLYGERSKDEQWDALKKAAIVTASITILFGLGSTIFMDFKVSDSGEKFKSFAPRVLAQKPNASPQEIQQYFDANMNSPEMVEERSGLATKDGMRSLFFLLAAALVLWFFMKGNLKRTPAIAILGVLFLFDVVFIGWRYLNDGDNFYIDEDQYEAQFNPRPVDQQIKSDPDPYYRVLDLTTNTFNDAMPAVHHKLVGGYSPAKLESYQDLIDVHMSGNFNPAVLDMLNTKYIIQNGQGNQPVARQNPNACGNAWFVNEIKTVTSADEEMLALNTANPADTTSNTVGFNPKQTAVVRKSELEKVEAPLTYTVDSTAKINLTEYSINHLNFESNNSTDGYAVFSDIYYPLGWKAYIDNEEAPIVKTNYLLRGLYIPKGNHKIKFEFMPETYKKYRWTQAGSSYLILIIILALSAVLIKKEWDAASANK